MAIILEAAYSKKLGLPNYSSPCYVVCIRTELSDLTKVEAESARLYSLLQQSVDNEIQQVGFLPDATRYGNPAVEAEQQQTGWRLLETFFRESPIQEAGRPDAVEVTVEADLASHSLPTLVGVLDLVQNEVVIDFKTSSTTPNPERAALVNATQATAYSLLYRENTDRKETGVELHHLVKLKQPKLVQ